jgi:O-antigen ligase
MVIFGSTVLFFVMVFNLLRTKRHVVTALVVLSVVSAATFAYAGVQRFLPGAEIAERVGWLEEGEAAAGVEISNIESDSIGTVRRSTGTAAHSNVLAANTAFLFAVLAGLMALASRTSLKLLALVAMACCLVGAVVSLSRTGMLTYFIVGPLLLAAGLLRITPMRVVLVCVVALASIPFLPDGVSRIFDPTNYLSGQSVSVSERLKLWQAAASAFVDHPFNGMGLGNNRGIFDYYHNPWNPGLLTVHSSYLQILIETGLPGLLVLGYFFYRVARLLARARSLFALEGDRVGLVLSTSLLIALVAFLLIGAVAFDFMRIGFKNMWLFIGCGVVLYGIAVEQAARRADHG